MKFLYLQSYAIKAAGHISLFGMFIGLGVSTNTSLTN